MATLIISDKKIKKTFYKENIIIASNKPYLFESKKDLKVKIESLQGDEWVQTEETWKLVDQYNECMKHMQEDERWIFESGYHIEGQGMPQAFSDMILLQHIFEHIFNQYEINKVKLCISDSNITECLVALDMARNRKINVKIYYDRFTSYMKSMITPLSRIMMGMYMNVRRMKRFYDLFKYAKTLNNSKIITKDVGIYIGSNAIKHYNWTFDLMQSIRNRIDNYVIITPDRGHTYQRCLDDGFEVVALSDYCFHEIRKSIISIYNRNKKTCEKDLLKKEWLISHEILLVSVRRQIYINMNWRMTDKICQIINCGSFLQKYNLKFLRGHGDWDYIENMSFYHFSRHNNLKIFRVDGVLPMGAQENYLYGDIIGIRYLAKENPCVPLLKKYGYRGELFFLPRESFIKKRWTTLETERSVLLSEEIKVLWAPSYIFRGFGSLVDFYEKNNGLFEGVQNRKKIHLYVKYHPNQNENDINEYKIQYPNFIFIDKTKSILDCISSVDIVITDYSTVVYEAASLGKVVCSIIRNENEKNGIYDIADYIHIYKSIEELFVDLDELLQNKSTMSKWINDSLAEQEKYYKVDSNQQRAADLIAMDLKRRLSL